MPMTPEVRQALIASHDAILRARARIVELEPKAHAYDTLAQFVRALVPASGSRGEPDLAQEIRSLLERDAAPPPAAVDTSLPTASITSVSGLPVMDLSDDQRVL